MNTSHTYVRARIDTDTKMRATQALAGMGLSVSDAIRLLMLRIAHERRMPFEVRVPNKKTMKAIHELESKKCEQFKTVKTLMDDLDENN
ncbi:MAG: type II toxin-antitoxin system RelB/DinJ family antitoxin [Pseudomonadota bacterium]